MTKAPIIGMVVVLSALSGCSFKPSTAGKGPSIKLAPMKGTKAPALLSGLSLSSFLASSSTPTSLSDLNCFAVNVKDGPIETTEECGGIDIGITDGAFEGIGSEFQPLVPLGEAMTFEAYGFSDSSCGEFAGDSGEVDTTVYKIGSVSADPSGDDATVTIPVSFNADDAFVCGGSGQTTVFFDEFEYASSGDLDTQSGGVWTATSGEPDDLQFSSSNQNLTTDGSSRGNTIAEDFDTTDPYTAISLDVKASSYSSFTTVSVQTGFASSASTSPTVAAMCEVEYTSNSGGNLVVGETTSSLDPAGGSFGESSAFTSSAAEVLTLLCELHRDGGSITIEGTLTDSSGDTLATASHTTSSGTRCDTGSCPKIVIQTASTGGGSFSGTVDNMIVTQSSQEQDH